MKSQEVSILHQSPHVLFTKRYKGTRLVYYYKSFSSIASCYVAEGINERTSATYKQPENLIMLITRQSGHQNVLALAAYT